MRSAFRPHLAIAASILLAAACGLLWFSRQGEPVHAAGSAVLTRIVPSHRIAAPAHASQTAASDLAVRVDVSPSRETPGPDDDLAKACRLDFPVTNAPWTKWIDLTGPRLEAKSSDNAVPVQAVRIPNGVAVLAVNHGERKATIQMRCQVSRGIFTVARLSFTAKQDPSPLGAERLQSVLREGSGTLIKPAWLMPGTGVVFRITNETRELGDALADVKEALHGIAGSAPRAFRLIAGPFAEAAGKVEHIAWEGGAADRDRTAKTAERAALSLSHAQTLFQNNRSSGVLHGEKAKALGIALDRLDTALAEVMAGSLDLVPNAELGDADQTKPDGSSMSVVLSNQGSRVLRMVKLEPVAPNDVHISPEDPAVFRSVRPGETVRATFKIQPPADQGADEFHADISYIAGKAPAHMRIRAF